MSAPGPAVLVMARAPLPGRCKQRLEPLLGPAGCVRLQEALVRRAVAWAGAVGEAWVAYEPAEERAAVAALVPAGVRLMPQRGGDPGGQLAAACAEILGEGPRPLLVAGTDVPALGAFHARAALSDLEAGFDVSLGPALGGGFYLIGLERPHAELFSVVPEIWRSPDVMELAFAAAAEAHLRVGLLRPERRLDSPDDVRAARLDPLTPPEVLEILEGIDPDGV